MTEIEINMVDYVAMQSEECLEWLEELEEYDDIMKVQPLCKFLRIVRNDSSKMNKFLEKSIHKYCIFKTYDKYQELSQKGIEPNVHHHLQILAPLCDKTAILLIELLIILKVI